MTRMYTIVTILLCTLFASPLFSQTAAEIEILLDIDAVTYSQAVRFALEASDMAVIRDPQEAFQYARERNLLPKNAEPDMAATLEGVSLIIMKTFDVKGGLFYSAAKSPHYAYRELVYKDAIQGRTDPAMKVSGDMLLFITGKILSLKEQEEAAGKTKPVTKAKTQNKNKKINSKEDIAAAINEWLEEQKVLDTQASVTDEGIMISLSNIQFQADVSVLPESEKRKLREIADILQTISAKKIIVAGHSARAGTAEAQRKISHDRAAAVGTYLGSLEACKNITIMPIGYGAEKPLADNASTDGMAANRRVEIIIVEQSK